MAMKRLTGVRTPHFKNTAESVPERIPIPEIVILPMSMHIGAPAKPIVKPGDYVKVGQIVAEANGFVSAPIHASVSGTVKKIEDQLMSNGTIIPSIIIEADGLQAISETVVPPTVSDTSSFIDAVRCGGIVGLGGAGFPTAVKLDIKDLSSIKTIIINGAECEPYITSDTRTMIDNKDDVWTGIKLLKKYLNAKHIIIAIEENKKKCIAAFQTLLKDDQIDGVEIKHLPSIYPQGGEKVLIYNTTGDIVPEGKLPIDVGAVVINCTTLAATVRFIQTGMPLVEKCITVDGSAIANSKNVIVPIGTPIKNVLEYCGLKCEPRKVLYGGPMMGTAVPSLELPVLKNTNALLALNEKDAELPKDTPCIRCGRCIAVCPLGLMPLDMERSLRLMLGAETLEKLKVNLCMECGCCSYVCPAKRPLVQAHKIAKQVLREYHDNKKYDAERKKAREEQKREAQSVNGKAEIE